MNEYDERLRDEAVQQIKRRREFWQDLVSYVIVNAALIGVWAITGAGYFWPGWAIGGLALWAFSPGCGRRTAVGSRRDGVQALRP